MVRPQRHREALRGPRTRATASSWPSGSPATPPSATPSPTAWPSRTPSASRSRPRPSDPRACSWNSNASTTTSPTSARSATTSATASSTPTPNASANRCCASTAPSPATGSCAAAIHPGGAPAQRCPIPTARARSPTTSPRSSQHRPGQQHRPRPLHRHRHPHHRAGRATSAPSATSPAPAASTPTPAATTQAPTSSGLACPSSRTAATCWPGSSVRAREFAASTQILRDSAPRAAATTPTRPDARHPPRPGRTAGRRNRRRLARHHRPPRRDRRRRHPQPGQDRRPVVLQLARTAVALTDTIVPDFPLANKSFNLPTPATTSDPGNLPMPRHPFPTHLSGLQLGRTPAGEWLIRRHEREGWITLGALGNNPVPRGLRNRDAHTAVPQRWRHHRVQRHRARPAPKRRQSRTPSLTLGALRRMRAARTGAGRRTHPTHLPNQQRAAPRPPPSPAKAFGAGFHRIDQGAADGPRPTRSYPVVPTV